MKGRLTPEQVQEWARGASEAAKAARDVAQIVWSSLAITYQTAVRRRSSW